MMTPVLSRAARASGMAAMLAVMTALSLPATAAPYAAMVIDARDGRVIFARNHDTRLHPASLTKMMTLYIAFEAVKHGEVSLDTEFSVSRNAANTPCSCLGVRAGQKIQLRYLIRAAALRSGNDSAVVIAEGISGSVEAFAERMTRTARAMGMENTTFLNPHGLTVAGHLSTARDMTILGRQLLFDYPQYYNIFSRRSDHAGIATVPNTNRHLLNAYSGADGIKTGYTRAAGFNLTASAQRGDVRIIATMFGGSSGAARNAHVAELLDIGFARAATRVATRAPATPAYQGRGRVAVAAAAVPAAAAAPLRSSAVMRSLRPVERPLPGQPDATPELSPERVAALQEGIEQAVSGLAVATEVAGTDTDAAPDAVVSVQTAEATEIALTPPPRPDTLADAEGAVRDIVPDSAPATVASNLSDKRAEERAEDLAYAAAAGFSVIPAEEMAAVEALDTTPTIPGSDSDTADAGTPTAEDGTEVQLASAGAGGGVTSAVTAAIAPASPASDSPVPASRPTPATVSEPAPEPDTLIELTSSTDAAETDDLRQIALLTEASATAGREIISRVSTSGGRLWGVTIGTYPSRHDAERNLIQTALAESVALENGLRRVRQTGGQFEAAYAGLTREEAEIACRRIHARNRTCFMVSP